MVQNHEYNEMALPSNERQSISIDVYDAHEITNILRPLADELWQTAEADKTMMRFGGVPLATKYLNDEAVIKWRKHNALSAAYKREDGKTDAGLVLLTPQLYDATRLQHNPGIGWEVVPYDRETPIEVIDNDALLRILKAKLIHTVSMFEFIDRLPQITDEDFPLELISHLQHMADNYSESRIYTVEKRIQESPAFLKALGVRPPHYRPSTKTEIQRSEGVEAVDYILRTSIEGIEISPDTEDTYSTNESGTVTNSYEFSFSVPYETDFPTDIDANFVVSGTINQEKIKYLSTSYESQLKAPEIFRNALASISQAKLPEAYRAS
jgi:hypothetical protein